MRPSLSRYGGRRGFERWATLVAVIAIVVTVAIPASASAAACAAESGATEWAASTSGSFNDDANWTQGGPSDACDVSIAKAGTYTVTMTAGASVKSLTLGGIDSSPSLVIASGTALTSGAPVVLKAGTLTGGGTIIGSVQNSGAVVQPGESLGEMIFSGSYAQEAGGRLEVEVAGTGAGQHDLLAVSGDLTRGGTLALVPTGSFSGSSAIGESFTFLNYGGDLLGEFASTTVSPSLSCPKRLTVGLGALKSLQATVGNTGANCGDGGGGTMPLATTPPPPVPNTKLGVHPGPRVITKLAKLKVRFAFSSDVVAAAFECKLDKRPYKACGSPKAFKVRPGKHRFSVRAIGPGGVDATPVSFGFKVIRQKG